MLTQNRAQPFCHFYLHFQPQKYLSLYRALIFLFILEHNQVRQVRNYYITIYNMKDHHFTWTSGLNRVTGIL